MADQPPTSLRDWGISVLRTGVPLIWGNLLVFLGSRFPALDGLLHDPQVVGFSTILTAAVALAWYALMRKVEPYIPPWLTILVLGSNTSPVYDPDVRVVEIDSGTGVVQQVYDEPADVAERRFPQAGRDL